MWQKSKYNDFKVPTLDNIVKEVLLYIQLWQFKFWNNKKVTTSITVFIVERQ